MPEGRATIQSYVDTLKEWVNRNLSTFNKGQMQNPTAGEE